MKIYRIAVVLGDQEEYEELETHDDNESGMKLLFGRLVAKYLKENSSTILILSRLEVENALLSTWIEIDRVPRLSVM